MIIKQLNKGGTFQFMFVAGMAAAVLLAAPAAYADKAPTTGSLVAQQHDNGDMNEGGKGKGGGKSGGSDSHADEGSHGQDKVTSGGRKGPPEGKGSKATTEEDSDRKPWAGGGGKPGTGKPAGAGSKKGTLYGDLWVILRDANGVPILTPEGYVQPLDKDGNVIPLNSEGDPIDPTAVVEVELGRLNVGRSPDKVLSKSLTEAVNTLNSATAITLDSSGRLVVTVDGVAKTIDSPLENLALYQALMDTGTLPGLSTSALNLLSALAPSIVDGQLSAADYKIAASFLAAAADKTSTMTIDTVAYYNAILGIDGTLVQKDVKYVDFSTYNYDRSDTYTGTVTYLKAVGDGTYVTVTEPIMTAVFNSVDYSSLDGGIDGFTQSVDDALRVIQFVHDHQIPVSN